MGKAIGGSLPLAVGIALSPVPIIAVVLMLTSRRAKVNGPVFVLGWLVGLGIIGAIVLALAGAGAASESGSPATWVSWVKIVLGVLLLLVAVREFRNRPREGEEPQMPKWMATIDKTTPPAAFGLAALLSGVNPKNLLLAIGGAAAIAGTGDRPCRAYSRRHRCAAPRPAIAPGLRPWGGPGRRAPASCPQLAADLLGSSGHATGAARCGLPRRSHCPAPGRRV